MLEAILLQLKKKEKKHTVKWTVVSGDVQIISIPLKVNVDV